MVHIYHSYLSPREMVRNLLWKHIIVNVSLESEYTRSFLFQGFGKGFQTQLAEFLDIPQFMLTVSKKDGGFDRKVIMV